MLSLPTLGLLACLWKPTVITSRGWCIRELCNLFAIARSYACTLLPEKYYDAVWRWFIHCSNFSTIFCHIYNKTHMTNNTYTLCKFHLMRSSRHQNAICFVLDHKEFRAPSHRYPTATQATPPPPPHTHKARASRGSASEVNEGIIFRMCILVAIHKAM